MNRTSVFSRLRLAAARGFVATLILSLSASQTYSQTPQESPTQGLSLDAVMSKDAQERTGVSKLSAKERAALEEWLRSFAVTVSRTPASASPSIPKSATYAGFAQKHWIKANVEQGTLIQLEDGSLWRISPTDKINTGLWLPTDNVVVVESKNPQYPYKLIAGRDSAEAQFVTGPGPGAVRAIRNGDVDLFDSTGSAVAYIAADKDMAIYLWSGQACAYLDDDNIYGFNGKHLGWFQSGLVYDHAGSIVAALAESFRSPIRPAPTKDLKQLPGLKGLKELKPLKPPLLKAWSQIPAKAFFLTGAE